MFTPHNLVLTSKNSNQLCKLMENTEIRSVKISAKLKIRAEQLTERIKKKLGEVYEKQERLLDVDAVCVADLKSTVESAEGETCSLPDFDVRLLIDSMINVIQSQNVEDVEFQKLAKAISLFQTESQEVIDKMLRSISGAVNTLVIGNSKERPFFLSSDNLLKEQPCIPVDLCSVICPFEDISLVLPSVFEGIDPSTCHVDDDDEMGDGDGDEEEEGEEKEEEEEGESGTRKGKSGAPFRSSASLYGKLANTIVAKHANLLAKKQAEMSKDGVGAGAGQVKTYRKFTKTDITSLTHFRDFSGGKKNGIDRLHLVSIHALHGRCIGAVREKHEFCKQSVAKIGDLVAELDKVGRDCVEFMKTRPQYKHRIIASRAVVSKSKHN